MRQIITYDIYIDQPTGRARAALETLVNEGAPCVTDFCHSLIL
jgi:hypothetical protein